MLPSSRLVRVVWLVLVAALVAATQQVGAASADETRPGREPGLPFVKCIGFPSVPCDSPDSTIVDDYGWFGAAQNGLTGARKAKQWGRIPLGMVASVTEFGFEDDYNGPWSANQTIDLRVRAFLVSPKGSRNNYGDSVRVPVRTVAFGSVPTEVVLQFSQSRDSRGELEPFEFVNRTRQIQNPASRPDVGTIFSNEYSGPAKPLRADIEIKVVSLKADGVSVRLGSTCTTGPGARLDLAEKLWKLEMPKDVQDNLYVEKHLDSNQHFYGLAGGSLHGTVDIPRFSGCRTTTGDDVSPLLTSAISGPDNPVSVKVGLIACTINTDDGRLTPIPPGVESPRDPRSGCNLDLGAGSFTVIPKPFPIPGEAP